MKDLIVHQVNITHYRLAELSKLADQAKPFYDWIEKHARRVSGSHRNLNEILLQCSRDEIARIIGACYSDSTDDRPFLFGNDMMETGKREKARVNILWGIVVVFIVTIIANVATSFFLRFQKTMEGENWRARSQESGYLMH